MRDGPVARAQIEALQQRAREQVTAPFARRGPRRARGERDARIEQRGAAEAREQIQVRVGIWLDRARDDEARRPERDECRGSGGGSGTKHAKRAGRRRHDDEAAEYRAPARRRLVETCTARGLRRSRVSRARTCRAAGSRRPRSRGARSVGGAVGAPRRA
ncbi:hypothetical protein X945_5819 [Burkholderia pseudomallei ABCPW 107]|nr:hypothetical protein X945_5819 [Burkholderia pseudomallei ABCPW 107]